MPMPFPKEFREGPLQLVREGDRPVAQIALELGIAESCLRRWIKQDELDRGQRADGPTTGEGRSARLLDGLRALAMGTPRPTGT